MKRLSILIAMLCLLICPLVANAESTITFAWDQSIDAKGYHVYKSPNNVFTKASPKVCTGILEPIRTCTINNVPDGLMWYAATAYDSVGNESDFSVSVSFNGDTTPPVKPPGFKISSTTTVTIIINP